DVGKVHPVFQDTMQRAAPEEHRAQVASSGPWAKSAGSASHSRPAFRHELVSALQVIEAVQQGVLRFENSVDPDLVAYLVGAHHGRVRLGIRALPRELESAGVGDIALGVVDGDLVPPVNVPG